MAPAANGQLAMYAGNNIMGTGVGLGIFMTDINPGNVYGDHSVSTGFVDQLAQFLNVRSHSDPILHSDDGVKAENPGG